MQTKVVLDGGAGELASAIIPDFADDEDLSNQIKDAMESWVLSPGDTIRIFEIDDVE
jgi:hypothetical protein